MTIKLTKELQTLFQDGTNAACAAFLMGPVGECVDELPEDIQEAYNELVTRLDTYMADVQDRFTQE
tara:strand:- start:12 stop:209 length:198 start_codon:yes stop_codon:yes gene_type:complete